MKRNSIEVTENQLKIIEHQWNITGNQQKIIKNHTKNDPPNHQILTPDPPGFDSTGIVGIYRKILIFCTFPPGYYTIGAASFGV